MKVYHDLKDLPEFRNAVITIGSFDGVHNGHQRILEKVIDIAAEVDGESVVVTFHPHPRLVLNANQAHQLQLITTVDEKIQLLKQCGIDHLVVVPFTVEFSKLTPKAYIEEFLYQKFTPKCIVVGYDHRFGQHRAGDFEYLKRYCESLQFELIEIERQEVEEIAVSSTKIRTALLAGDVKKAHKLLGHYFRLTGTVVKGQQIGTTIGFPTANLELASKHKLIPPDGIYAVYCWYKGQRFFGMLYIGSRPTIEDSNLRSIEVNIFNFQKNIYGDKLSLELVDFIRHDQKFESLDAMVAQLKEDKKRSLDCLQFEDAYELQEQKKIQATVGVVILNYNGRDHLANFLPSVLESEYSNFKIYVADNGSTDDSLSYLESAFPEVLRIDLKENFGFAEGYNQALKDLDEEYFILLNSDVEVTRNWIAPVIELMERDKTIAACQPKILAYNDKAYFEHAGASGGWMDKWGYPFCRGRIMTKVEQDEGQYNDTQEIFWASGAAMFIRSKLYKSFGGFDGEYFAHLEEIDLCWRLKRAGYKIMVRPKSVVYHVGGGTLAYDNPRKTYLNFRNSLFTILKNESTAKVLWLLPLRLVLDGLAGILFLTKFQFKNIGAIIKAHWHFFPRIPSTIRKRKAIKELVLKNSIAAPNSEGIYYRSIVWQHYVLRKKQFRDLKPIDAPKAR